MKKTINIYNEKTGEFEFFQVQVNKNGGICGIFPNVSTVLTDFQGQQLASELVLEHLSNVLYKIVNG